MDSMKCVERVKQALAISGTALLIPVDMTSCCPLLTCTTFFLFLLVIWDKWKTYTYKTKSVEWRIKEASRTDSPKEENTSLIRGLWYLHLCSLNLHTGYSITLYNRFETLYHTHSNLTCSKSIDVWEAWEFQGNQCLCLEAITKSNKLKEWFVDHKCRWIRMIQIERASSALSLSQDLRKW